MDVVQVDDDDGDETFWRAVQWARGCRPVPDLPGEDTPHSPTLLRAVLPPSPEGGLEAHSGAAPDVKEERRRAVSALLGVDSLTVSDVALALHLDESSVLKLIKRGLLHAFVVSAPEARRRNYRITVVEVRRFISEAEVDGRKSMAIDHRRRFGGRSRRQRATSGRG